MVLGMKKNMENLKVQVRKSISIRTYATSEGLEPVDLRLEKGTLITL